MTIQAWIIMTQEQCEDATGLDDGNAMLGAAEIVNPLANELGQGTLAGKWVSPARLLDDPDYV